MRIFPYEGLTVVMRKRCSCGKGSLTRGSTLPMGKFVMNSTRDKPFLVLRVENSKLNSWRMMIHRVNLRVISHIPSIYYMGLELAKTFILRMNI